MGRLGVWLRPSFTPAPSESEGGPCLTRARHPSTLDFVNTAVGVPCGVSQLQEGSDACSACGEGTPEGTQSLMSPWSVIGVTGWGRVTFPWARVAMVINLEA